jgi:hypothetical protein
MTTKNTIVTVSLALVAFVFGCVTEALVVPPVRANPNPNATRWEYKCIANFNDERADKLGAEGWELVTAMAGNASWQQWCFKHPLP